MGQCGQSRRKLCSIIHPAEEFAQLCKRIRWIELGVVDFVPGEYFWFAHGHRSELDAIFVDRVVLIGAEPSSGNSSNRR